MQLVSRHSVPYGGRFWLDLIHLSHKHHSSSKGLAERDLNTRGMALIVADSFTILIISFLLENLQFPPLFHFVDGRSIIHTQVSVPHSSSLWSEIRR